MPTKRARLPRHQRVRVTPEAVEAYRAGEWMRLHNLLGLNPWEASPLDVDDGPCPWPPRSSGAETWPQALELRNELEKAGG